MVVPTPPVRTPPSYSTPATVFVAPVLQSQRVSAPPSTVMTELVPVPVSTWPLRQSLTVPVTVRSVSSGVSPVR